jgi:hypothetical protein
MARVRFRAAIVCAAGLFLSRLAGATCFDGVRDGPESDVDCGGDCPACERGDHCATPHDCYSGRCAEAVCSERTYPKGTAVPAGYRVETSEADGAAITRTIGWWSLGFGYAGAYVAALSLPGELSYLYVPVAGPWIKVADKNQGLRGLIAVDGFFQTVGASLVIYGIAASGRQLVRDEGALARRRSPREDRGVLAHLFVSPGTMGSNGYGVWASGTF